jgi:hypothetical protein
VCITVWHLSGVGRGKRSGEFTRARRGNKLFPLPRPLVAVVSIWDQLDFNCEAAARLIITLKNNSQDQVIFNSFLYISGNSIFARS